MRYIRFCPFVLLALAAAVAAVLITARPDKAADGDFLPLRATADLPAAALGPGPSYDGHSHEGDLYATTGAAATGAAPCDKDIDLQGSIGGLTFVAAQDNGICDSADIDVYEQDGELFVAQAGGRDAAFTITRIDADGTPTLVTQKTWQQTNTWTPDVKAFKQDARRYLALSLQRLAGGNSTCGAVIVDVTDAPDTLVVDQVVGSDWCDVHNSFVENDANGDGRYLYITANLPDDLRVLDIGDLDNISEIGRYTHPEAGPGVYVHDITVVDHGGSIGRRVYVSYWNAGVMILDAADLTPGVVEAGSSNQPLNPGHSIDPLGFYAHHAYPSQDGTRLFIQDEFLQSAGQEPVQMWDISAPAAPAYVEGIPLGSSLMPVTNPAHNLHVHGDRLYVGWYKAGLQAFRFQAAGFVDRVAYHQVQTEAADDPYDGAWGIRLATIGERTYAFQSDRRYGLIVDDVTPIIDTDGDGVADGEDMCPGTIGDPVDGNGCSDAQVDADGDGACDPGAPSAGPAGCSGSDNCPATPNANQLDVDTDGQGDACDPDIDDDGALNDNDNCPAVPNPGQADADADGVGDDCDNCPTLANAAQTNTDADGRGDECDLDDDGDGYWDIDEAAKASDTLDADSTPEHCDGVDNDGDTVLDEPPVLSGRTTPDPLCAPGADPDGDTIVNSADTDDDGDGLSDANERYLSTDELADCRVASGHDAWPPDADANGTTNIGDVIQLFGSGRILQAMGDPFYSRRSEADANGNVNVGDLIQLFGGGIMLTSC